MTDEERQIGLADILITEELYRRSPKTPKLQAENQALHTLGRQLAVAPQTMLKTLVQVARELCGAGTAGVSFLEISACGESIFRWVALAGVLEQYEQKTTPGSFSSCGVCLERQAPQLYLYPERYFTYFQQVEPTIVESLVIPLIIDEQPLGTLWIVSHDEQQQFDSEDVRLMTSLASFTAATLPSSSARQAALDAKQAWHQSQAQMQSLLANIPGMVYRYLAGANGSHRFTFISSGCRALFEVEPEVALQDADALWNQIHPNDRSSFQASVAQATKNFLPWDWQGRIITPSGKLKWIQGKLSALRTIDGDVWDGWLIDITERRQIAAALQQSEELMQRILESSNDCIKVLSLEAQILSVNIGGLHLLEIDEPTSLLNADWLSFWQGKDNESASSAIAAAKMGNIGRFQAYCPTLKGKPKWWDVVVTPIRNASGQVVQLLSILRDITDAKCMEAEHLQAEIALRSALVQLESAVTAGAIYTWHWDVPANRLVVNAALAHLFSVDPASAITDGLPIELFLNAIHQEDRARVSTTINQALETGEEYVTQYRVRTISGEERWLKARGRVDYDLAGNPLSFPGALVDITELKQSQEALQRSEELYRTLFGSIEDGFCIIEMLFDQDNTPIDYLFLETNPAFEKQTGLVQAEGKRMLQLAPTHEQHWFEIYGKIALTGESARFENRAAALNRWYKVYACRVGQQNSRKVAILFEDVSQRKQLEVEREQIIQREQTAREAAETANRIKDEFLAVLSHELRSPLNPILGWSNLLRRGKLDAVKTAHALETIERNAKLQVQLIEDLLDVSRILRGKLSLNRVPVNLAALIIAALETVQLAAQAKSIQIQTKLDPIGQVLGDSIRLQQVIWNLVSNAVKFTPQGGQVKIVLERVGSQALLQVSDTGKGIHSDFLPYVFDYFRQADSTTTRTFGGLGLGLAIVRQLVELHGGSVDADSPGEGRGATFIVRLPLLKDVERSASPSVGKGHLHESTSSSLIPRPSSLPFAELRVLLVDDDTDARDLIAFILEQNGALVTSAANAAEAIQAFEQTNFDVLISDIGMPQMDGYMLLRQIRSMTQGTGVLALALTAYAGEINQQQALAAGFQKHITKPVEPEDVVKVIAELIEQPK